MIEKERWVPEKSIMVRTECQDSAEAMRVERERPVKIKRRDTKEQAAQMELERQAAAMKRSLEFTFRICPINFSLMFSLRSCKIDLSCEFGFR